MNRTGKVNLLLEIVTESEVTVQLDIYLRLRSNRAEAELPATPKKPRQVVRRAFRLRIKDMLLGGLLVEQFRKLSGWLQELWAGLVGWVVSLLSLSSKTALVVTGAGLLGAGLTLSVVTGNSLKVQQADSVVTRQESRGWRRSRHRGLSPEVSSLVAALPPAQAEPPAAATPVTTEVLIRPEPPSLEKVEAPRPRAVSSGEPLLPPPSTPATTPRRVQKHDAPKPQKAKSPLAPSFRRVPPLPDMAPTRNIDTKANSGGVHQ